MNQITTFKLTEEQRSLSKNAKRSLIQQAAVNVFNVSRKGTLNIDTGVGKCKIAIDIIKKNSSINNILITSPRTNLKENWIGQIYQWFGDEYLIYKDNGLVYVRDNTRTITFNITNVQTAYKWYKEDSELNPVFDMIIADEIHTFVTPEYSKVFSLTHSYTLGLTATPDINKDEKREIYDYHAPIIFKYNTAQKDGVVNDVDVIVIDHILDDIFKVVGGSKAKQFLVGESKNYKYLQEQVKKGQIMMSEQGSSNFFEDAAKWFWNGEGDKDQKTAARIYLTSVMKRKNMLLSLSSTRIIATKLKHKLLDNSTNKVLIFSELTAQANHISKYTVHSGNTKEGNEDKIRMFHTGNIRELSSCYSLTLGLNMSGANNAIFESYQGSHTLATQRKGRLHRLNENEQATMYVIRVLGTQSQTWFNKFVDEDEINNVVKSSDIINDIWNP